MSIMFFSKNEQKSFHLFAIFIFLEVYQRGPEQQKYQATVEYLQPVTWQVMHLYPWNMLAWICIITLSCFKNTTVFCF